MTTSVFEPCFKAATAVGLVSVSSVALSEKLVRKELSVGKPEAVTVNVTTEITTPHLSHASPVVDFAHDVSVS